MISCISIIIISFLFGSYCPNNIPVIWFIDQVAHVGIVESSDDTRHQWNKIRLNWAQDSAHEAGSTGTEPVQGFVKKTEVSDLMRAQELLFNTPKSYYLVYCELAWCILSYLILSHCLLSVLMASGLLSVVCATRRNGRSVSCYKHGNNTF